MQENSEMSVVSLVRMLPETKQQIETFSKMVVDSIVKGEVNPLEVDFQLKCFEMAIDRIRKDFQVKELLITEAEKYKSQDFKDGSKVSVQSRTTYEYSHNPTWAKLNKEIKNIETLMKTISDPMADANSGEITEPAKVKSVSTFVKYDFKK